MERVEGVVEAAGRGGHVVELPLDVPALFGAERPSCAGRSTGRAWRLVLAFFDSLSFTHRREYVEWIEEAKREETRRRRVDKAVELLRGRVRTPG